MQDQDSPAKKKEKEQDKKTLLNTLSQSINPLLKQLNQDDNVLVHFLIFSKCQNLLSDVLNTFNPSPNIAWDTIKIVQTLIPRQK
jgi:hypothetical protein